MNDDPTKKHERPATPAELAEQERKMRSHTAHAFAAFLNFPTPVNRGQLNAFLDAYPAHWMNGRERVEE